MRSLMTWYTALFCVAFTISAHAQQSASGRVVDVEDKGISGVLIKGTLTCERPIGGPVTLTGETNTVADGAYSLVFSGPGTSGSSCFPATISITSASKQ